MAQDGQAMMHSTGGAEDLRPCAPGHGQAASASEVTAAGGGWGGGGASGPDCWAFLLGLSLTQWRGTPSAERAFLPHN